MQPTNDRITYAAETNFEVVPGQEDKRTVVGYPVVWGAISTPRRDGTRHRFGRDTKMEWADPTLALWHHNAAAPVGNTANGSLRMRNDIHGVRVEIDLPDTSTGRDAYTLIKGGYVRGMSFGGVIRSAGSREPGITDVAHFAADEVTITPTPAMTATSIDVATFAAAPAAPPAVEDVTATPAVEAKEISEERQERGAKPRNNRLAKYRLALYEPGRVSG